MISNNDLVLLFSVSGWALFSIFALPTIYQLQIKEYYLPRVRVGLKERNEFWIPFKLPAKSFRNLLIFAQVVLITFIYFVALNYYFDRVGILFILLWLFGSFVGKFSAFFGMFTTEPLALFKRGRLISAAKVKAAKSNATFIGVTGSYGKSSVKEFLISILGSQYKSAGTKNNYNSEVGVAISVLQNLRDDTEYFIAEMAAYNRGTIATSASIVSPKIGFISGLGNQHIALFGSKENILKGKSELVEALPADGVVYVNKDCDGWEYMRDVAKCKVVTYSIRDKSADAFSDIKENGAFHFKYKDFEIETSTDLPGDFSILNLTGVIAAALDLGISPELVGKSVKELRSIEQKLSTHILKSGALIVDDSYNSNEAGFIEALQYIGKLKGEKKAFSKGLLELGDEESAAYSRIIAVAEEHSIQIYSSDPQFVEAGATHLNEGEMLQMIRDASESEVILSEGRFSPKFKKELMNLYK